MLCKKNLCEYVSQDFEMVWAFQQKNMQFAHDSELKQKYAKAANYLGYYKENHAETFAMTVLMCKAQNEDEFQWWKNSSLKKSCRRQRQGVGGGKKACYNCYPSVTAVCRHLEKIGAQGRRKFLDENGCVDFLKVNEYAAKAMASTAYSRKEFAAYQGNQPSENGRWQRDTQEAQAMEKNLYPMTERDYWADLFLVLKTKKDATEAYECLARPALKSPQLDAEKKRLAALFLQHNPLPPIQASYYAEKAGGR